MSQLEFFEDKSALPEGLNYSPEFITREEEEELVASIQCLEFGEIKMHGVIARRRAAHFGKGYEYESSKLRPAEPLPEFLLPLRKRVGALTKNNPRDFVEVLVTEYRAGAGIGWHRDAPVFDFVVGISLLSECTMKFRPWPPPKTPKPLKPLSLLLEPRSAYVIRGPARTHWQHHIPQTRALRYSITFRTLRETQL
jgi:DNA oxidative demethylase